MGAYENPTIPVDTQSGQYYRELQNTIATSFAGVAKGYSDRAEETRKEYETRKKEIQANIEKAEEYGLELYSELNKAAADNKAIDWNKTYDPLIKQAVKLRSGLLNGSVEDRQAALTKLAHIKGSVSNVQNSIADLNGAGNAYLKAKLAGPGAVNGLATANELPLLAAMEILTNEKVPGKKELIFRDNDPTQPVWKISGKLANGQDFTQELDAGQVKNLSNSTGLLQVVKDPSKEYMDVKKLTPSIFVSEQKVNSKGEPETILTNNINEQYLGPIKEQPSDAPGTKIMVGGKVKETQKILYREVDKAAMRNQPNSPLMMQLKAKAEANLVNPVDAYNQNNDVFVQSSSAKFLVRPPVTQEEQKQYIDNYINYFFETQVPPVQVLEKTPSDVTTTTYKAAEATKVSGGGNGSRKPTAAQNKMWQLNKKATEQIKNNKTSAVIVDPLDTANGIQWDPNVVYKNSKQKGGWVPVTYNKDKDFWINIEGNTKAIRSRTKAAETYLRGFDAGATTIEEYFSRVNPNSEDYDGLPTYNEE
jgi:hypothetical protein